MQFRNIVFATNEIYHIYNRSIAKEQIFNSAFLLKQIFEVINYYRYPQHLRYSELKKLNKKTQQDYLEKINQLQPLVEIYSFAFMPNHYHILLKQTQQDGIKQFISIVQNSYAKYFNKRLDRQGSLFQSPFKGKWIETDEQFLHVSRYIHLNPVTSFRITSDKLFSYRFTSFPDYYQSLHTTWVNTEPILKMFSSREQYCQFVLDQADYQKTLAKIKDTVIE